VPPGIAQVQLGAQLVQVFAQHAFAVVRLVVQIAERISMIGHIVSGGGGFGEQPAKPPVTLPAEDHQNHQQLHGRRTQNRIEQHAHNARGTGRVERFVEQNLVAGTGGLQQLDRQEAVVPLALVQRCIRKNVIRRQQHDGPGAVVQPDRLRALAGLDEHLGPGGLDETVGLPGEIRVGEKAGPDQARGGRRR